MTGKRLPFPPLDETGERPADMFGDSLDTLPMPDGALNPSAEAAAAEPPSPVGYASPPLHTRWKKGGPSPNPRGRPPKRRGGKLFAMMEQLVEIDGPEGRKRMTRRAVLDRNLRAKAMNEGGKWWALWEKRQRIDAQHRQRVADYQAWRANQTAADEAEEARMRRARGNEHLYQWLELHFAGVHETEQRLLERGVIVRTPDGLALSDEWRDQLAAPASQASKADAGSKAGS